MKTKLKDFRKVLKWKIPAFLGLIFLFSGCVDFEGQTLTYRYDTESDRLLCFQVYENINGSTQVDKNKPQDRFPSAGMEERNQLESVMTGQRTFFFDNWLVEYDREQYVDDKEKAEKELLTADASRKPTLERIIRLVENILDSVEVKNGGFYLNARNQLCGYQYVTISNASKIVTGINGVFASQLQADLKKSDDIDEATWIKIQEAIDEGEWIQMEGNQFRIRWVSYDDGYKECGEGNLLCAIASNFERRYAKPFAEIIVGQKNDTNTELKVPPSLVARTELIEYVAHTYGMKGNVAVDALRDEFLRTGRIPE